LANGDFLQLDLGLDFISEMDLARIFGDEFEGVDGLRHIFECKEDHSF